MRVMNTITDKPDWDTKVFDEEIISKWRNEITESGQDISSKMMDYIIKELQWKAELSKSQSFIKIFDAGVVKSDTAIPEELRVALVDAVAPLENIPVEKKDYHPGSDDKVIDLVHPSLFPLVYGHTRILPDQVIDLDNCLGTTGQGEILETSAELRRGRPIEDYEQYSKRFQWLPCDIKLSSAGAEPGCQIVSYINNLHPVKHRSLYGIIEKVIARAIPLWDSSLTRNWSIEPRIPYKDVEFEDSTEPEPIQEQDEDDDDFDDRTNEWERARTIKQPEPSEFKPQVLSEEDRTKINIYEIFGDTGLQVIVKLANIELTPEKPEYGGGTWHIEGQLNERICATAIYYYDCENITESSLSFRQRMDDNAFDEVSYEQERHEFVQQVYGMPPEWQNQSIGPVTQYLGGVVCREGRLLAFPNILQHRVSPFSLADPSKPGHRKILALFLVDPHMRIISTANIPPQQEEWGVEKRELVQGVLSGKLPPELQQIISKEGISHQMMNMQEAKKFREELMEERSIHGPAQNAAFEMGEFSLCEH
ncbi:hypothetical protein N7478_000827 [Penicillium angulare]|uniref:uncharacterized protein n=1 Tax=Penicillium angulare TaxID=116970 RepID=UPI00254208D7|nr:uncharacterized protein N7478_000827 [Penicillium angulare]KAJ5291576.1 hypothetical protein N7478_000827 [Penicillium angulare]